MRVIAGSVILEPGLKGADFKELAEKGVRLRQGRVRRGQNRIRVIPESEMALQVCTQSTARAAIEHGDIAAIGAVVTAGVPRFVGRSRSTPGTTRKARVAVSRSCPRLCSSGALSFIMHRLRRVGDATMRKMHLAGTARW